MTWLPSIFNAPQSPPILPSTSTLPKQTSTLGIAAIRDSTSSPPEKKEPFSFSSFCLSVIRKIPFISSLLQFFFPAKKPDSAIEKRPEVSQEKTDISKTPSEEIKQDIHTLLEAGATWSPTVLVTWYAYSLKGPKSRLDESKLHPLTLLGHILSSNVEKPLLEQCLKRKDSLFGYEIGEKIREGIANALEKEAQDNNLIPYLRDFARNTRLDHTKLVSLVSQKQWNDFILALFPDMGIILPPQESTSTPSSNCTLL